MCMACPSEREAPYARSNENSPIMMIIPRQYIEGQEGYRQAA